MGEEMSDSVIIVVTENSELNYYLPLCVSTLKRHCDPGDLRFGVYDGLSSNIREYLSANGSVVDIPAQFTCRGDTQRDVALRAKYMIDAVQSEWAILCHYDVEFFGDAMSLFRGKFIEPKPYSRACELVGQVGSHNRGIVAWRIEAWNKCTAHLDNFTFCYAILDDSIHNQHGKTFRMRHESDVRCVDKSLRIDGFDCFELLEIDIQQRGYRLAYVSPNDEAGYFHNHGSTKTSDFLKEKLSKLQLHPL